MAATVGQCAGILVVEDDPGLAALVRDTLRTNGYAVWLVESAAEAEAALEQLRPDLIVLDLMLPDRNGLVLCAKFKERARVPVVICSATKRKDDPVLALQLGADDFLRKPFSLDELQARIDRRLGRAAAPGNARPERPDGVQAVGTLSVDERRCLATVAGEVLRLTPTEYRLLAALAGRAPDLLARRELAEHVWECVDQSRLHALDVYMRRLRAKLAAVVGSPRLVTRRGFGYQLVNETETRSAAAD
jgi:DNA-binding response OmpR family regulator